MAVMYDEEKVCIIVSCLLLLIYVYQREGFELNSTKETTGDSTLDHRASARELKESVKEENKNKIEHVLDPECGSADDLIFDSSIASGQRNKKSLDIRSKWNSSNNQWKKYYDQELGEHESRIWWEDDEEELSRKHVVI
jgi:hypothetical protein